MLEVEQALVVCVCLYVCVYVCVSLWVFMNVDVWLVCGYHYVRRVRVLFIIFYTVYAIVYEYEQCTLYIV